MSETNRFRGPNVVERWIGILCVPFVAVFTIVLGILEHNSVAILGFFILVPSLLFGFLLWLAMRDP